MQHKPTSPILVLEHNIIHAFENPHPGFVDRLARAVTDGFVLPEIALRADLVAPVAPKTSGDPAEIDIHVTHFEVLWAFVYAWMVIYEEQVQKVAIAQREGTTHTLDTRLTERAHELLEWAESAAHAYTPWPAQLPSPDRWQSPAEEWYAGKANRVFQEASSFLLLHEWAHSTSYHLNAQSGLSDDDYIDLEKDADNTAFDVLVGDREESEKTHLGWAVLSALLSSFYLLPLGSPVKQYRHPELHHRVHHLLQKLDFADARHQAYFHGLCAEVLRRVFTGAHWVDPPDWYETEAELLAGTLDQLDRMLEPTVPVPLCRSR